MDTIARRLLAAMLLVAAGHASAQGYKCRQADGSTSYQDHPCAAGTASSSVLPGGAGGPTSPKELEAAGIYTGAQGVDAGCQQSARRALTVCLGSLKPDVERCEQRTMSADCRAKELASNGRSRDQACVQQQFTCNVQALGATKQCLDRELPAACRAQIDAARGHRLR
jgi:hypothetical protein